MEAKTNKYQLILVLDPTLIDKGRDEIVKKVKDKLEKMKTDVISDDHMGLKEMQYKIKTFTKGDYWVLELESKEPIQVKEFDIFLNREVKIIRYLLLKRR